MLLASLLGLAITTADVEPAQPTLGSAGQIASTKSAAVLPSGSSEIFQRRMMQWTTSPEDPPLRIGGTEVSGELRLDRLAISSRFGWRSDPITGAGRRHAGLDLPGRYGSPVMAAGPGIVRIAGWDGGYGRLVEIEHPGGVRTRYGHLSRIRVWPSEHVEAGQVIGQIGSTGHSTGPHLHYEIRVGGIAVDPLTFISQSAPDYETVWGRELRPSPKWLGWTGEDSGTLPEPSFR